MSIAALIIFCAAGFFSLPVATAQGLYGLQFGLSPFGLLGNIQTVTNPSYLYNFGSSPINQWGAGNYLGTGNYLGAGNYFGASNGLSPLPSLAGSRFSNSPLRTAHAYINGATTVFISPSATNLQVVVKQGQGIPGIKLSALTAPLTVYIYPTGYVPPVITPTTTAPVTTAAPAVISGLGGLQRVNLSPYRSGSGYSFGQSFISPWATPSFVPFMGLY